MRKILFLAANPEQTSRLRLDQESREIGEALRRAKESTLFDLEQRWAVRPDDLRRAILDLNPQIVHFSGHGSGEEGLALENKEGKVHLVSTSALSNLFKLSASRGVECIVLNACYSEIQAKAIAQHITYVVGMSQKIGDKAAIKFAVGFYDALGAGCSFEQAYEFGCNAIELEGIPEHLTPIIKKNSKALGKSFSNDKPQNVEWLIHDKDIFLKSDNLMSERQLLSFLEDLEATHCYLESHSRTIVGWIDFFKETGNQFLTEELSKLSHNLVESLKLLDNFLCKEFFVFPNCSENLQGNTRFCMQPGINIDRTIHDLTTEQMLIYDELVEELYSHTKKIRGCYKEYRLFVKKKLTV